MNIRRSVRLTLEELSLRTPRRTLFALGTIGVEAVSRALGWLDFRTNREHSIWKVSESTKAPMTDELRALYSDTYTPLPMDGDAQLTDDDSADESLGVALGVVRA